MSSAATPIGSLQSCLPYLVFDHRHLTRSMTLGGSAVSLAVPLYQSLLIVMSTAAGGILFNEFGAPR